MRSAFESFKWRLQSLQASPEMNGQDSDFSLRMLNKKADSSLMIFACFEKFNVTALNNFREIRRVEIS